MFEGQGSMNANLIVDHITHLVLPYQKLLGNYHRIL
jgi:hypothetical protein